MDFIADFSVEGFVARWLIQKIAPATTHTAKAWWNLSSQMPRVNRAYNQVRAELEDIGLLYDPPSEDEDGYLDQIRLQVSYLPSLGEAGYVFEQVPWYAGMVGYEEGVIYLPADVPATAYVPGGTLTDVIRHEYAHAWHWLEPEFFERPWFRKAFGGEYVDCGTTPGQQLAQRIERNKELMRRLQRCRNERERTALMNRTFFNEFVSEYAATSFCEDFAETFMTFLRYRNSLGKFKGRVGVHRKLLAVENAVQKAASELGTS